MPHWLGTFMVLLKDGRMTKRNTLFKQTKRKKEKKLSLAPGYQKQYCLL